MSAPHHTHTPHLCAQLLRLVIRVPGQQAVALDQHLGVHVYLSTGKPGQGHAQGGRCSGGRGGQQKETACDCRKCHESAAAAAGDRVTVAVAGGRRWL